MTASSHPLEFLTDATETLGEHYCPISPASLAKLCAGGEDPGSVAVRKALDLESLEIKGSTVSFVSTSGVVDRDNDIIRPKGLSIDAWLKNPVILFSHDARQQIGVGDSRLTTTNKWLTEAEFYPKEFSPLADGLRQMIEWRKARAKRLKTQDKGGAFSIGFISVKSEWVEEQGGFHFLKSEKLEDSFVALPSNRDALAREAFSDGVPLEPLFDWAENVRKERGIVGVNSDVAQRLIELIDPPKGLAISDLTVEHLRNLKSARSAKPPESAPAESDSSAGAASAEQLEAAGNEIDGLSPLFDAGSASAALAFTAAQKGLTFQDTNELLAAAGFEQMDDLSAAAGTPADEPDRTKAAEPPSQRDWQDDLFVSEDNNGLPEEEQIKQAFASALSEEDLRELLIERVAARTGHIPEL